MLLLLLLLFTQSNGALGSNGATRSHMSTEFIEQREATGSNRKHREATGSNEKQRETTGSKGNQWGSEVKGTAAKSGPQEPIASLLRRG